MPRFADLFRKYRLKSELATLSDFGSALAEEGKVYEDSIFSHWQKGKRIPHNRDVLFAILKVFVQKSGVTTLLEANQFLAAASQRDLSEDESLQLSPKLLSSVPFTVPQEPAHFVGREKSLKDAVWAIFKKTPVVIHGMAGVGKTTLAIRIGHILRNRFKDGILWYRFDILKIDDILTHIAQTYGEDVSSIRDTAVKAKTVRSILDQRDTLLILDSVDNFDSLRFLLPAKDPKYSLLITSKSLPSEIRQFQKLELTSFTQPEALQLAYQLLGKPYVLSNKMQIQIICKQLYYSPLALTIFFGRIALHPQKLYEFLERIRKQKVSLKEFQYDNKNLELSLDLAFNSSDTRLKQVFISLGAFGGVDFSSEAVAFINKLSLEETNQTLQVLHKMSLVERSVNKRYRLHSLVKIFVQKKLNTSTYHLLALYYHKFLADGGRANRHFYPKVEEELKNITGIVKICFELKLWQQMINIWEYLGVFLWDTGRWSAVERYSRLVVRASQKVNNASAEATCLLRELCWLHYWQGDINKAQKYAQVGLELAKGLKDAYLIALAWIRLGKIYQSQRHSKKALRFFQQALTYFTKQGNQEKQGDIFTYIGETYWMLGKRKLAKSYLRRALRIVNTIDDLPQKETILSRIGCIFLHERQFSRAINYLNKSLLLRKHLGYRIGDMFWNYLALGLIYYLQGDSRLAQENFRLARKGMAVGGYTIHTLNIDVFPFLFQKKLRNSGFYPKFSISN
ncbi:hypothetical protein A2699_01815 [Candidatus Gottesmanbacteria bacterium RIFCSPHIGHO2_01_FULL_43_15]|nr:MAG: hypothetical protein A2699_01815 [Candidatus Gottesmanbacteria bacterium RIFCSPHIGHO2_01_FULL_43_15]